MNQPPRRANSSRATSQNISRPNPFPATVLDDSVPIEERRSFCRDRMVRFSRGQLDGFVDAVLADDQVVCALSACRLFEQFTSGRSEVRLSLRANDSSVLAARRAANSQILAPAERSLAGVAAYLYGIGLYMLSFELDRCKPPVLTIGLEQALIHRRMLLEEPLRKLRSEHPELGALMAAALELGSADDCDPEQLARVLTAVRLANLSTEQHWLGELKARS